MSGQAIETAGEVGLAGVLFQRSNEGLLLIDASTERILDANPAAERLTEFPRAELLEMSLRSMIRHEQDWHDWTLSASKDDADVRAGFLLRTRQAECWVPVRLGMTPIPGGEGQTQFLIRLTDGRVGLANQRREQKAVVPDEGGLILHGVLGGIPERPQDDLPHPSFTLEAFGRVLGAVSHDFGNLMTGILGHLSLSRLDAASASAGATMARIESIATRAADLCRQLATCAGHDSRRGYTPDPAAVIRRAVAGVAVTAPNVMIVVEADAALSAVSLDPTALAQAVEELTRNAIQAGATRVVVRLGSDAPALPLIFAHPHAEPLPAGLHIQVQDDGEGVSDQARRGLGEPFFTTRPGQRGLGLPTVLGIARANQGSLRLHSLAGAGTIVLLSFPPGQATPPEKSAPPAAPDGERPLVLLVEDVPAILDEASRLLTSAGCRVVSGRNGVEAVALYRQHAAEIRLVLLDMNLPRLSGDKVAAEIRRLDAGLPIALMSGHHELEGHPELADLRLAGCLQKPFRMAEIYALLERVLGMKTKR